MTAAQHAIVEELYQFEAEAPFPIFDHVVEFIRELKSMSVRTALVTSSDDAKMKSLERRHPGLCDMFDAVITGSMVKHSKPAPEGYLKASKAIRCKIENCAVFEDSLQGLEAGRASGARLVVALATTNPANKLLPLADMVIPSFEGLQAYDILDYLG